MKKRKEFKKKVVVLEAWEELELVLKSLGLEFGTGNREKVRERREMGEK